MIIHKDSERLKIYEINSLSDELKQLIDTNIVEICNGISDEQVHDVKRSLYKKLKNKNSSLSKGGFTEFFIHLILKKMRFQQASIFNNLETTNSLKRGSDALYTNDSDGVCFWIVESKSSFTVNTDKHSELLKVAYQGIKASITNTGKNNPFQNAVYHRSAYNRFDPEHSIFDILKQLSKKFENREELKITDFNIIPTSTISIRQFDNEKDSKDTSKLNFESKDFIAICVHNTIFDKFLDYLNEGISE